MDLTIQILTRNNEATIAQCLASLSPLNAKIQVADLGSTDRTIQICENKGLEVGRRPYCQNRSEVRNWLTSQSKTEWQMAVNPWEILIQGHDQIEQASSPSYYVSIIQESILTKDIRIWRKSFEYEFVNPVFEYLETSSNNELPVAFYSTGNPHPDFDLIETWKLAQPTSPEPYYYHACLLLSQKKYDDFLRVSEHYMFIDNRQNLSNIMNHYYYAMIQIYKKKSVRAALQNINICLCARPLMAEFWCLIGDVYYHRLNNFEKAKQFYEIAIFLGGRRLREDKWPMDISKYKEYPTKMIASCVEILKRRGIYFS